MFYYLISKYKDNEKRREESYVKMLELIKQLKIENNNYKILLLEKERLESQDRDLKNMENQLEGIEYNVKIL